MIGHVQQSVHRKISDFIRLEEGRIGNRNAMTVAALVTTSAFAGLLLSPQLTSACLTCTCPICFPGQYCCDNGPCDPGKDGGIHRAYSCDGNGGQCG